MALLYLDGEDEITTAVGRIRSSDDAEVALVLPPGSRIGTSRINFRLLAREARDSDRHVVIVTLDAGVRSMAVSAGLPAYASVAEYERGGQPAPIGAAGEPGPGRAAMAPALLAPPPMAARASASPARSMSAPRLTARRGLVVLVVVAVVALGGAGAVFVLPSAEITIVPKVEAIGPLNRTIVADPAALSPDLASGIVPATEVALPLEASDTFPATGLKVVDTPATGKVTFSNNDTGGTNTISAGSIVATDAGVNGVKFRTLSSVTVPKARFSPTFVPGKATVRVEAVATGPTGNLAANAIDTVPPGKDSTLLTVTNTSATSGGTHTETKQVAQADVDGAMSTLQAALASQLAAALAAPGTAPPGSTLIPETAATGGPTPNSEPASLVGSEVDSFKLTLTADGSVVAVQAGALETMADQILAGAVPAGSQLLAGSVDRVIGQPAVQGGKVTFVIHISAQAWRPLDAAALLASVKGRSVADARTLLASQGTVTIQTWPGYVDTIPTLEGHATLTVVAPGLSPTPTP